MKSSNELRQQFIDYFAKNGHKHVKSSPLIPAEDPTLLFTNAGMVQFKETFLGNEKRVYSRAVSSQKCMRVSGKHNDLENVGHTPRHHTFFEMLGNFSFGDYFKKDAIDFAWEFLMKELSLPKEKLWITIFETDDEAEKLWLRHVSKDRIFRLGEKDNFWSMGDTGPCGPCSEIHWDFGEGELKKEDFEGDRLFEIWNLVFMQYNRDENGKLTPLAKPSIDTGMGLERITAIVQGKKSNWETDLFMPLIEEVTKIAKDISHKDAGVAKRVIADHARAAAFLIADGIIPSNEGRGYVLRRLLRRAVRYGKLLGLHDAFIYKMSEHVVRMMGNVYPELITHKSAIEKIVKNEEQTFFETLDRGVAILEDEFKKMDATGNKTISGDIAFKLYDTYGFPFDLTTLMAGERGFNVDEKSFCSLLNEQKEKSRVARVNIGGLSVWNDEALKNIKTKFVGYNKNEINDVKILAIVENDKLVQKLEPYKSDCLRDVYIITDKTPFYGEKGGQIGDTGKLIIKGEDLDIRDAIESKPGLIAHALIPNNISPIKVGDVVTLKIDYSRRQEIKNHHTATHLLHSVLRKTLGSHVRQMGSFVSHDKLRFDFSHFQALTSEEKKKVENEVNRMIRESKSVETKEMDYEDALSKGALAFFEDKYADKVRVVSAGDESTELCGGTHAENTGDIKLFKIVHESSVASGIRRIEAVAGLSAEKYVCWFKEELLNISKMLNILPKDLEKRVEELVAQSKGKLAAKEIHSADKKMIEQIDKCDWEIEKYEEEFKKVSLILKVSYFETKQRIEKLIKDINDKSAKKEIKPESLDLDLAVKNAKEVNGTKLVLVRVDNVTPAILRNYADQIKANLKDAVSLVGGNSEEKAQLILVVGDNVKHLFHAGKIMQKFAEIVGGKGGGRPDMAQGGGSNVSKLNDLFESASDIIEKM